MSRKAPHKRTDKSVNIPIETWQWLSDYKDRTGVPIVRFIMDAIRARRDAVGETSER